MAWGPQAIDGGMRFRLWAPGEAEVSLRLNGRDMPMVRFEDGWFEAAIADVKAGDVYAFVTGDGRTVPDPAARRQKGDVLGPSLVASSDYRWRSDRWK